MITPSSPGPHVLLYTVTSDSVRGSVESTELHAFNDACGHFTRLLTGRSATAVSTVECICYEHSSPVLKRFKAKKEAFKAAGIDLTEQWVFHGSSAKGIAGIVKDGFKVGGKDAGISAVNGTAYGHGVYTASGPNTPMAYAERGQSKQVVAVDARLCFN